jgi:hypothetical protein
MRPVRPYAYLGTSPGLCSSCGSPVPCRILESGGAVHRESLCPACGTRRTRIAGDVAWYMARMRAGVRCAAPRGSLSTPRLGCPLDCGPCALHAAAPRTVRIPVGSAGGADALEVLDRALDRALGASPRLERAILEGAPGVADGDLAALGAACRRRGVGRAAAEVRAGPNGFDAAMVEEAGRIARACLDPIPVLSMHAIAADRLRDAIRSFLDAAARLPSARRIVLEAPGGSPDVEALTLDEAALAIEEATGGEIKARDFGPDPAAHPLCGSLAARPVGAIAIAIHAPMSPAALDPGRLAACADVTALPDGRLVPSCMLS